MCKEQSCPPYSGERVAFTLQERHCQFIPKITSQSHNRHAAKSILMPPVAHPGDKRATEFLRLHLSTLFGGGLGHGQSQ